MAFKDMMMGLIVIVLWGLNFIAIKVGLVDVPPLLLGALRFIAAAIPAVFFLKRPPVPIKWLIALGLSINVGQFAFLFMGMKLGMPAGLASLVLQSQAFFTMLIAVMVLKEKMKWHHLLGLAVAGAGMTVIGTAQGGNMTLIGFWLTLAAALSWGTGNIIMRRATQGVPPFSMLSLSVWAGVVAILPLLLMSYVMEGPQSWVSAFESFSFKTLAAILYLGLCATILGYGLWGKLLAKYPAASVAPFALLVPIVGMSSSAVILNERLTWFQIVGAVLVMLGLLVNVFGGSILSRVIRIRGEF